PATALNVACDDPQRAARLLLGGVEEGDEWRAGYHRFDAGDQLGLCPVLDNLECDPFDHLVERISAEARDQADQVREDREELVDVLAGEKCAAGRGRAADEALHSKLLGGQQLSKLPDLFPVVLVRVNQFGVVSVEAFEVRRRDRLEAEKIAAKTY